MYFCEGDMILSHLVLVSLGRTFSFNYDFTPAFYNLDGLPVISLPPVK